MSYDGAGMCPQELTTAVAVGGRDAIMPRLMAMNAHMVRYRDFRLLDILLQHSSAKPIVVEWHEQWTQADKAAMMSR